jgi:hypothetical protein
MKNVLRWLAIVLAAVAAVCVGVLLARDSNAHVTPRFSASAASSAALLLIGMAFLIVQMILRPPWTELLKNMLLSAAFILWGAVQGMAPNALSMKLGDVVIALYVLDLAWMILASVIPAKTGGASSVKTASSEE